jgi:hypothetical protein
MLTLGASMLLQNDAVGSQAAAIHSYVRNGGGVVNGAQAWYWSYTGSPLEQHPSNILLAPVGILVSADIDGQDYTFTSTPPSQLGNSDTALSCFVETFKGNTSSPLYLATEADRSAASESITGTASILALDHPFWTRLQKVRRRTAHAYQRRLSRACVSCTTHLATHRCLQHQVGRRVTAVCDSVIWREATQQHVPPLAGHAQASTWSGPPSTDSTDSSFSAAAGDIVHHRVICLHACTCFPPPSTAHASTGASRP